MVHRQRPLGPVDPSFRALSGRLEFAVRRHKFNKDSLLFQLQGSGLWAIITLLKGKKSVNANAVATKLVRSHAKSQLVRSHAKSRRRRPKDGTLPCEDRVPCALRGSGSGRARLGGTLEALSLRGGPVQDLVLTSHARALRGILPNFNFSLGVGDDDKSQNGSHNGFKVSYRGTSLIRNQASLGPYSRKMPRVPW